jgi:L-alanine-DL-glutamate epimerase-like enolase superfamily enzyme
MKIVDVQVIPFWVPRRVFHDRELHTEGQAVQTLTKIITDEGAEGYLLGGYSYGDHFGLPPDHRQALLGRARRHLIGENPFDRERIWHNMWVAKTPEDIMSILDMALWDLQARLFGLPISKLLGGCRDKVRAYASTYPNIGTPQEYADHALACKAQGYTAYKIHPYYFADPITFQPVPGRPSFVKKDIEACRLVREAVGDDMVLMFDPWGTYHSYEEALWVGRELEKLNFYWYEHPMPEHRVQSYVKLTRELDIPICSPEIIEGSVYTRADWILREAADMSRIDVLRGGITGCKKLVSVCEAYGVKCEMHISGFGNLQILGATSEDVCEYYERGLLAPGVDNNEPEPYLEEISDRLDADGYVHVPQAPGMGYRIVWDYIQDNLVKD